MNFFRNTRLTCSELKLSLFIISFTIINYLTGIFPASIAAEIAQLGERQTEDLKVPGSNPENSYGF